MEKKSSQPLYMTVIDFLFLFWSTILICHIFDTAIWQAVTQTDGVTVGEWRQTAFENHINRNNQLLLEDSWGWTDTKSTVLHLDRSVAKCG